MVYISSLEEEQCKNISKKLHLGLLSANESIIHCAPLDNSVVEASIVASLLCALTILTAGGNILIMLAIFLVRKLRDPCNLLIANLALTDFLVSILVLPFAIVYQTLGYWPFENWVCDIYTLCDVLLCTSSILSLCAISIDRYMAITKPLQYATKRTVKRMLIMIIISWFLSAAISIPPLFGWEKHKKSFYCGYSEELGYQLYATVSAFYIPLVVMLVLYGRIFNLARQMVILNTQHNWQKGRTSNETWLKYKRSSCNPLILTPDDLSMKSSLLKQNYQCKNTDTQKLVSRDKSGINGISNQTNIATCLNTQIKDSDFPSRKSEIKLLESNKTIRWYKRIPFVIIQTIEACKSRKTKSPIKDNKSETHKAILTLGVIMGCFTICWLPFFLCQLFTPIINAFLSSKFIIPPKLFQIFLWLGYFNSFLNPIIYAKFNREFRVPFVYILRCQCSSINIRIRTQNVTHQLEFTNKSSCFGRHPDKIRDPTNLGGNRARRRPTSPLSSTTSNIEQTHLHESKIVNKEHQLSTINDIIYHPIISSNLTCGDKNIKNQSFNLLSNKDIVDEPFDKFKMQLYIPEIANSIEEINKSIPITYVEVLPSHPKSAIITPYSWTRPREFKAQQRRPSIYSTASFKRYAPVRLRCSLPNESLFDLENIR